MMSMIRGRGFLSGAALSSLAFVIGCSGQSERGLVSPSGLSAAAKPGAPAATESTAVSFSGFDPTTLTVTINTLTTATVGQPYISQGKIHLQILVNSSGNPVPCGTSGATYVRFDGTGSGLVPDSGGATATAVDLDNLDASTGGAVHNVKCDDNICIRAQYITGGGSTKVGTHFSDETPYHVVCPSCTLGLGYWKNHYPAEWPAGVIASGLTIGTVHYTAAELESILQTAPQGNGLIILAHQLITTKLNQAKGTDVSSVASAISAADTLIGSLVVPPVGGDSLAPALTGALTTTLDNFNSGITGPGACAGQS